MKAGGLSGNSQVDGCNGVMVKTLRVMKDSAQGW
jgi:hypothetical protein